MHYNKGNSDNMHSYSTNTQVIITGLTSLHKGKAILPMLLLILLLETFTRSFYRLPNTSGLLTIMLMYCIFKFGIHYGIINALLAIVYTIYYYALPVGLYPYKYFSILAILCNTAALTGTLLIMGLQRSQLQSYSSRLEKSEKKLSSLFQNANDSIFLYRLNEENYPGKYIEVNATACSRLGYTEEEFMKMSPFEINALNPQQYMAVTKRLLIDGHYTIETVHAGKDGRENPVEVSSHMIMIGNERMVLAIARDLSDRKKAEMLEENFLEKKRLLEDVMRTDQFKTELFSNISHELKTPINVIFSTLQLMELFIRDQLNCDDTKAINKYLHITKQNSYRLLRLVNNSIDLSKIDSGYFQLSLQNYDIVSLVEDIVLSVADYVEHKSIELQFDTDIEELLIACDPDKIERIILNLLSNAVKFTERGGSIFVNIQHQLDTIYISVKDTGVGIPVEKLETVFQRYKQLNESLIKNSNGSGIGLSLVKSLVEMHDGNIRVYSELDKGSEFVITLPIRTLPEGEVQATLQNIDEGRIERISVEFSDIYT